MTTPPLEPLKNYVAHRVEELLADKKWYAAALFAYENDAMGPSWLPTYVLNKATGQAEREWSERMDVLLDADINNLELHNER